MTQRELAIFIKVVDQSKAAVNAVIRNVNKMGPAAQATGKKMQAAFKKADAALTKMGKGLKAGFGLLQKYKFHALAVVAVLGLAVKSALEFQKGLSKVATLVDNTGQVFGEMAKRVKALSVQFAQSTKEITAALFDVISSTFKGKEAMEVLAAGTRLAAVGFSDVRTATSAVITTVQNYTGEIKDAADASDFLFAVQQRGRLDIEQLAANFGKVASTAKAFGVTIEDLGVSIAAISRAGIRTEEVFTELRALLLSLAKATPQAKEAALKYGLVIDKNLLSSGKLVKELAKLKGARLEDILIIFAEVEALRGYNDLIKESARAAEDYETIIGRAAVTQGKMAELTKQSHFQMEQFTKQVHLLKIELGEELIPTLTEATKGITSFVEEMNRKGITGELLTAFLGLSIFMRNVLVNSIQGYIDKAKEAQDVQPFSPDMLLLNKQNIKDLNKLTNIYPEYIDLLEISAKGIDELAASRHKANEEAIEEIENAMKLLRVRTDVSITADATKAIRAFKLIEQQGKVTGAELGKAWQNANKIIQRSFDSLTDEQLAFVRDLEQRFPDVMIKVENASKKMAEEMKKHYDDIQDKVDSVTQHIQDRFSDVIFARLTQKGRDFKDTMIDIFKDMGDSILRQLTNTMAKAVLGIPMIQNSIAQMATSILGGFGGPQALAPGRVTQTTAGGLVSGATGVISNAGRVIAMTGAGNVIATAGSGGGINISGGQQISPPILNQLNPGQIGGSSINQLLNNPVLGAMAGLLQGNVGGLIRGGFSGLSALAQLAYSGTGTLAKVFAGALGRSGTRLVAGAGGLAGGLGGLAASLLFPAEGLGGQIGGGLGSIGGSIIGGALGGPIGAGIGAFAGGILGNLGGGLFGGGGKKHPHVVPALNVSTLFPEFKGVPLGAGMVERNRDFGAIFSARQGALNKAFNTDMEKIAGFGGFISGKIVQDLIKNISEARELNRAEQNPSTATGTSVAVTASQQGLIDALEKFRKFFVTVDILLENALTNAFSNAFEQVDMSAGWKSFTQSFRDTISTNFQSAVVEMAQKTPAFKNMFIDAISPLADFIADQADKDIFNIAGFNEAVANFETTLDKTNLDTLRGTFDTIFSGLQRVETLIAIPTKSEIADMYNVLVERGKAFGREDFVKPLFDLYKNKAFDLDITAGRETALELLEQYEKVAVKIESSLGNAIAAGLGAGFQEADRTQAWDSFKAGAKQAIFDSVLNGTIDALSQNSIFKKILGGAVAPIEQVFGKLAEGIPFDTVFLQFKSAINNIIKTFENFDSGGMFGEMFDQLDKLKEALGLKPELAEIASNLENSIFAAVSGGMSAGLQEGLKEADRGRGFDVFEKTFKENIFNAILSAASDAIMQSAVIKNLVAGVTAPLDAFFEGNTNKTLQQSLAASLAGIGNLGQIEQVFNKTFGALGLIRDQLIPAEAVPLQRDIRIPRLHSGGTITRSGLAFVDRGESFSGVGNSFGMGDEQEGGGIYIDLRGAHLNVSSSQNIRRVAEEIGDRVKFQINKAKQFSNG